MSDLTPITREEALLDGADLEPITRKEQFIKRIYDKTQEIPEPITREEWFLKKAGEGTSPITIEQLNATENGTYSEQGKAYSPVIVEVPEPTLIAKTITENGTYNASSDDADGYSSVTVAVDGFKKKSIANTPTDIASFNDGTANPMPSLEISIEPVQDLHGYDTPWAGGAGKNKFLFSDENKTATNHGVTASFDATTETFSVVGTETSGSSFSLLTALNDTFHLPNFVAGETYYCSIIPTSGSVNNKVYFQITYMSTDETRSSLVSSYRSIAFTIPSNYDSIYNVFIGIQSGATDLNYSFKVQIEEGSTATSYESYKNICPISGWSEANVTVTDDLTTPTETHTLSIPFHDSSDNPITVYGGTLDVTSGELRVTHTNIASYNGETINEPWISSMDVYSAGTTPTTGAQVVYPLTTPQTYQLTPTQVTTLLGLNNIFADCGQVLEGEYFVTL